MYNGHNSLGTTPANGLGLRGFIADAFQRIMINLCPIFVVNHVDIVKKQTFITDDTSPNDFKGRN